MLYNVAQLLKAPAGSDLRQPIEGEVKLDTEDAAVLGPVTGEVRLQRTNQGILAKGSFTADLRLQCVRCLDPFEESIAETFTEMYLPLIDVVTGQPLPKVEDDQNFTIDLHHQVDLREAIRQQILLSLPMRPLCRDDCAGLCPICGGNRNERPCTCEADQETQLSVFAELRILQLDDLELPTED